MVREIVTLHVGQCGNQIGRAFWSQVLAEHANVNPNGVFEHSMSTFFRNVDDRTGLDLPIGDGLQPIYDLKARAVLIDMESGPVSETLRGELGDLFDKRQYVTDVSGAGNNWAHGNAIYGPKHNDELLEVSTVTRLVHEYSLAQFITAKTIVTLPLYSQTEANCWKCTSILDICHTMFRPHS